MTKRITTGKRDREKLKEQKRKEKLRRKEDRKGSATTSFEEMIAYVDQNGQLHSAPQDNASYEEVDISEILVSVPKQEYVEAVPLMGRVEHFNSSKGYGFIKELNGNSKYFFHVSSAPSSIAEGDTITFELEQGMRGINAVRISINNK